MKLIDKSALVSEIEKYYKEYSKKAKTYIDEANYWTGKADAYHYILTIIDTLEAKDVDLEKEIDNEIETRWRGEYLFTSKFRESARHFFELGLKVQKGE